MQLRLLILVALLGVTGWLHGRWTDRWGEPADVSAAGAALPNVPLTIGEWEGRDITREESEIVYRSTSPQIVRRYVHRTTGAAVGLLITCGRPSGMIIEHAPKECYKLLGFEESGVGERLPAKANVPGDFFAHTFVKTGQGAARLRLLWSWGDGEKWSFPDRPRVAFAKKRILYKLYVTRELASEDEPLASDPAIDFLRVAIPEIQQVVGGGSSDSN